MVLDTVGVGIGLQDALLTVDTSVVVRGETLPFAIPGNGWVTIVSR
jgi:hypothetical protein